MMRQQTEPSSTHAVDAKPEHEPRPPICLTTYSTRDLRTPALSDECGEIEYGGLPVNYRNFVIALHCNPFRDALTCR
jgi:hypothetical protein